MVSESEMESSGLVLSISRDVLGRSLALPKMWFNKAGEILMESLNLLKSL